MDGGGGQPVEEARGIASVFEEKRLTSVVIDTELDFIKLEMARPLAESMNARYLKLEDLRAGQPGRRRAPGVARRRRWDRG